MTTETVPLTTDLPTAPQPTIRTTPDRPRRVAAPTWRRDLAAAAMWGSLLFVTGLWVAGGQLQQMSSLGGILDSWGRLTGLLASDLLLIQVLMMARIPLAERAYGQDELARRHRLIGFTSFTLMVAHIVLITLGYAADSSAGLWGTIVDLVLNYPGMLLAVGGTVALCMVVATSIKNARGRLRYESWHLIHLYGYLGAGLALPHQLWTGADFSASPAATLFWWELWIAAAVAVVVFRIGRPLYTSWRHGLRVESVEHVNPTTTTVTVRGRDLDRLPTSAGQFFQWRFLDGPGWTRAHPYSLSHAPDGRTLKVTVAHLGDGSARTATLSPGTRVLVEGPYGRLHSGVRTQRKVLLLGAGIGITPLRALLEDLEQGPGDVTMIYRAHSPADIIWRDELTELAASRGARLFFVTGVRVQGRDSWLPESAADLSDAEGLRQLVPDIAAHDVFVCGASRWMDAAEQAARDCGVPDARIHAERFSY